MSARLSPAIYLAVVFLSGVAVGGLGQHFYTVRSASAAPGSPEDFRKQYMAEMKTRLNLTPDQETKLTVVLDETREMYHAVRQKYRPEMKAIQDQQVDRVNLFLSPAQQTEYAVLRKEREEKRKTFERKSAPPR